MQVDLERLKRSVREELSKLEDRKSHLEEGLLSVEALEHLSTELVNPDKLDSSPGPESEDSSDQQDV